jgi:GTP pyrophosphokinase
MPALTLQQERVVEVGWEAKRRDIRYAVEVEIEAWDRSGLLADIMNVVNETRVHATSCNAKVKKTKAQVRLCMEINDKAQLDDIVKRLSHLKDVISVGRATSPGDFL